MPPLALPQSPFGETRLAPDVLADGGATPPPPADEDAPAVADILPMTKFVDTYVDWEAIPDIDCDMDDANIYQPSTSILIAAFYTHPE